MSIGSFSHWVAACAAMLAAPAALACENPDDIRIALRDTPPSIVQPGEVLLELDRASMEIVKAREETITFERAFFLGTGETKPSSMTFAISYATFRVKRVIGGDFKDQLARLNVSLTSTCFNIGGPSASFLVGKPTNDKEGIPYIIPRSVTGDELRVQFEQNQKAGN